MIQTYKIMLPAQWEPHMQQTYIGSQPIYKNDLSIFAYQLLFRGNGDNTASFTDGDKATSDVILNSLTDIGLDKLVGNHKACINFTRNFILGEYPIPGLKRHIIIEIQHDVILDKVVIEALHQLSDKGYTLAIPEAIFLQHFTTPSEQIFIVKFNITQDLNEQLESRLELLRGDNIRLLAEKIETHRDFTICSEMEFDYYQGFFFCQPNIVKGRGIPASKVQLIRLLQKLQDENTASKEIDQLISADVSLSYRLLRYANSSMFGLNTRIESIQHAVSLLGWDAIRMIATLLVLSSIDDKPPELFHVGLLRAKLCEHLSTYDKRLDKNMAFTAGLLSIIDALLDAPMDEVLAQLPLNQKLTQALLSQEGELGAILHDSIAYIHNRPDEAIQSGMGGVLLREGYLKALIWSNAMLPAIQTH